MDTLSLTHTHTYTVSLTHTQLYIHMNYTKHEGKMKDSPPPKKEEKSEGGVTLSYQRGEERQGVRKVKLVLRRHYGDNGQLKSNGKTKTPVIKFEFDLHKDDP